MISKVTFCPFTDTEFLAATADKAIEPLEVEIAKITVTAKDTPMEPHIKRLDDLFMAAVNAVQNETIRNVVCQYCDQKALCSR